MSWRQALRRGEARGRVFLRSSWTIAEMLLSGRPRQAPDEGWLALPRLDGIGDFWLWLPFVAALRSAFPERKVHLLANTLWADLARATRLFDMITPLHPWRLLRSPRYRQKVWAVLLKAPGGMLFNTTPRRRIAVEDSVAWFYPATHRVASPNSPDALEPALLRNALDKKLYNTILPACNSIHEWSRYASYVRSLSLPQQDFTIYEVVRQQLGTCAGSLSEAPFLIAVPGASVPYKVVAPALMAEFMKAAHARTGLPIVILGGKSEMVYARLLREQLASVDLRNLTGQLSLSEALACVDKAVGVIGVDTGLTHVAATWAKPTLVLMGGGHWGRFFPYPLDFPHRPFILHQVMPCYGCGWFCRHTLSSRKPYPCITALEGASLEPFELWLQAVSARSSG